MPTYDYKCKGCSHAFEQFQSMKDSSLRKCPACGKNTLERLIGTGAAVIFKGSGFYQTDYRSESYKASQKADSPAGDAKPEVKGDAKSDAKAEPKAPAKDEPAKAAASPPAPAPAASPTPSPKAPKSSQKKKSA